MTRYSEGRTLSSLAAEYGVSKTTVHKYMNRTLKLYSVCRRKKPGYLRGKAHKIFQNLLNQNSEVESPNRVWCTNFTYLNLDITALLLICMTETWLQALTARGWTAPLRLKRFRRHFVTPVQIHKS